MKYAILPAALAALAPCLLLAQEPPAPARPPANLAIEKFDVVKAALPGSKREWAKLVWRFRNDAGWLDGLSFNVFVLVEPPGAGAGKRRVMTSGLTYSNVPTGINQGILYLSPLAVQRFGTPIAVRIEPFKGDRPQEVFEWKSGEAAVPANWMQAYPSDSGSLQITRSTPWIILDSDLTPDLT